MDEIICGHVLDVLKQIPDESIDCVVTSPPYWSLRDYKTNGLIWDGDEDCEHEWEAKITKQDNLRYRVGHNTTVGNNINPALYTNNMVSSNFCVKCGAWRGSLGLEPTFQLYLQHLLQIFDEIKRVLKKTGTCWVNLGDTYASSPAGNKEIKYDGDGVYGRLMKRHSNGGKSDITPKPKEYGKISHKSLCLIPERFAIVMIDNGWILRNTIIWHKPNCMPASAKDRFTVNFEYVFFFVKSKEYYFEQQFEPHITSLSQIKKQKRLDNPSKYSDFIGGGSHSGGVGYGKQGRNCRCVWTIPTRPFKGAHFATFPEALIEPMIKAGCPEFVCKKCGKARERIVQREKPPVEVFTNKNTPPESFTGSYVNGKMRGQGQKLQNWRLLHPDKHIGYTACGCNTSFDGGIVLDPFIGSGTTAVVALKLNHHYLGIELNEEYCQMARKRIAESAIQLTMETKNAEFMREINQ